MEYSHIPMEKVVEALKTDAKNGLSTREAERRLESHGKNELIKEKKKSIWFRLIEQFKDFMILVLLVAAGVSFMVSQINGDNEYIDSIIILAIVICNAVIGLVQEIKADRAIEALQKLSSPHATVIRDGRKRKIVNSQVVPGDLVVLKTGDLVPADIRLVRSLELKAEESALTGESAPVEKDAQAVCAERTEIGDRKNMVFASTGISAGHGLGIVTATGMDTAIGRIAQMLAHETAPQTPLQEKLKKLGKSLGIAVILICLVIFGLGLLQEIEPFEMFMIAISLAVAAIPEGMPAVVTIVLAAGVKRMAQKRAIVRHMPAVETLGSTQVICSDKTGTLTQNKLTVVAFATTQGEYALDSAQAQTALALCSLCNNAEVNGGSVFGDPTETAFLHACKKNKAELDEKWPRVGEIPFSSSRKRMTTAHKSGKGYRIITKGAPDVLLQLCTHYVTGDSVVPMDAIARAKILHENERLADQALRVLAVACKEVDVLASDDQAIESDLIFCGLLGMEDPPRKGVKEAVATCKKAGIIPVMITGDHAATAKAIGARLGFEVTHKSVVNGKDLDKLSESALVEKIFDYRIYARVSPEHKVRIVKAYQKNGMVVAMSGDGVNDAPALKAADIGCAMGKNGTEVAKSAADMVLTDDDFSTIVSAVREGRGIFANIRKTIHFLLSSNIGEILLILASFLMRLPSPLVAIQLLWVNLVTDSLPALALGAEPIDEDIMMQKPHKKDEGIFSGGMGISVVLEGALIGALALFAYTVGRVMFDTDLGNPVVGRTMAFTVLCFSQLVHSFNMRSHLSLFKIGIFSNKKLIFSFLLCSAMMVSVVAFPPLAALFRTTALNVTQWMFVAFLALIPLLVGEIMKALAPAETNEITQAKRFKMHEKK